jgi:hypothetical protein
MWKYLANREKNLRLARAETRATSAKTLESVQESWGKQLKRPRHAIYRGVLSRTRLDSTVARSTEGVCPLWRFEGDVFLPEFIYFRGNGSFESTRFPEGLVLGNSIKLCHPRNVGVSKFMRHIRETGTGKRFSFMKKRVKFRILTSLGCCTSFRRNMKNNGRSRPLYLSFRLVSGCAILAEV